MTPASDEWLRVQAHKRGDYYHTMDKWYYKDGTVVPEPPEGGVEILGTDEEVYVAVIFTPNEFMANVEKIEVAFSGFNTGTTALTGSCWTSIAPNFKGTP